MNYKRFKSLVSKNEMPGKLGKAACGKVCGKKNRKSVVDFNDLEHFVWRFLQKKGRRKHNTFQNRHSYRERFAEILVDEYQDSNLVQETIINMISKGMTQVPVYLWWEMLSRVFTVSGRQGPSCFLKSTTPICRIRAVLPQNNTLQEFQKPQGSD